MNNFTFDKELLASAQWIWPNGNMYLHNSYAVFRFDFDQTSLPAKEAMFLVTADQSYRLYVNGQYVCRGPARGYQLSWPYDEVDILPWLKIGHNFISILAHNPGESNFSYRHAGRAAMLCAAKWNNGIEIYSNNESWKMKRSMGHNPYTAKYSVQLGFQEDFDASIDDLNWLFEETVSDDTIKQPKWTVRNGALPFGKLPYFNVEPRHIPMLREELHCPEKLMFCGYGRCAQDYRNIENCAWFFIENEFLNVKWDNNVGQVKQDGRFLCFDLPASGDGMLRIATIDLGRNYLPGTLLLEVEGGIAGEIVDVHYHQLLVDDKVDFVPPGACSLISMADRLRMGDNKCKHEFYHIMGVRQFSLVARENCNPLRIRVSWRSAVYPMQIEGGFKCSDELLNQIYQTCCHTQQICSMDAFVDTPWREQGQYIGDLRVQAKNFFYLTGDPRLLKRGLEIGIAQKNPYHLPYAVAPSPDGAPLLPDFALTWIMCVYDYYSWTGKLDLFVEHRNEINDIFAYFEQNRTAFGAIRYDERFWLFEDWGPLPKEPVPAFLNLWHLYTMMHYQKLLSAAGLKKEAKAEEEKIKHEKTRLKDLLWDQSSGLISPILSLNGEPQGEPIIHDQVLAILTGLLSDVESQHIKRIIYDCLTEKLSKETIQPSAFWSTYLLEAASLLGFRMEAVEYIKRKWSKMVQGGATWEVFERGDYPGWSYSHAWSAHPVTHLPDLLVGLRQVTPGWTKVVFEPLICPNIDSASLSIPTPLGMLSADWQTSSNGQMSYHIDIPEGMTATINLPMGNIHEVVGPIKITY